MRSAIVIGVRREGPGAVENDLRTSGSQPEGSRYHDVLTQESVGEAPGRGECENRENHFLGERLTAG